VFSGGFSTPPIITYLLLPDNDDEKRATRKKNAKKPHEIPSLGMLRRINSHEQTITLAQNAAEMNCESFMVTLPF
jgi:hypothetical protein